MFPKWQQSCCAVSPWTRTSTLGLSGPSHTDVVSVQSPWHFYSVFALIIWIRWFNLNFNNCIILSIGQQWRPHHQSITWHLDWDSHIICDWLLLLGTVLHKDYVLWITNKSMIERRNKWLKTLAMASVCDSGPFCPATLGCSAALCHSSCIKKKQQ